MEIMHVEYQMLQMAEGWNTRLKATAALSGIRERNEELLRSGEEFCNTVLDIAKLLKENKKVRKDFAIATTIQKLLEKQGADISQIISGVENARKVIKSLLEGKSISRGESREATKVFNLFVELLDEDLKNSRRDISRFMSVKV